MITTASITVKKESDTIFFLKTFLSESVANVFFNLNWHYTKKLKNLGIKLIFGLSLNVIFAQEMKYLIGFKQI